jgi:transcriptional regulator with XRE-family HTH domain
MSTNLDSDDCLLFGLRLAKIRKSKGFSQEALSLKSGIAQPYLSGVERGKRNISLKNICHLARILGVEPCELLKFDSK